MENSSDLEKRYTYADYLTWRNDRRCELVNGFVRTIFAPNMRHQEINGNLFGELRNIIKRNGWNYKIFSAPFDVRFPRNGEKEDNRIDTVVQPDICIVCDPSKLDKRGCLGAPDFVVEFYSVDTARYISNEKFTLYEEAGVREYWFVFPPDGGVLKFTLQPNGKYDQGRAYETAYETDEVPVHIFGGLTVDLKDII